MRVLVTGAAGFIGSHVCERLLQSGHEVSALDDFSTGSKKNISGLLRNESFSLYEGDVRDEALLEQASANCEATVHLAAIANVESCTQNPKYAVSVNVDGTRSALDSARWNSHKRFVLASSAAVYGEPRRLPVSESAPTCPRGVYGATKLASEALTCAYRESFGISVTSLRFFNVYGPRQPIGDFGGVVGRFVSLGIRGIPLELQGSGRQTRDFVYVTDAATAVEAALLGNATGAFNVGTGVETSVAEVAKSVSSCLTKQLQTVRVEPRTGDVSRSVASIRRIRSKLGWKPKVGFEEGIRRTVEWYAGRSTPQ